MNRFLAFLFLAATAMTSPNTKSRFFLGTFTENTGSRGIYTGMLDTQTGAFGTVTLAAEATNPTFLAASPDGQLLYTVLETAEGAVGAFRITREGGLAALNTKPSGGKDACHVSLDSQGRHVFVANYGGGSLACLPIAPDGSLADPTAAIQLSGSGPHPRQGKSYAHAINADPEDRRVYVCDLGADTVWIFDFDKETGRLTPRNPSGALVPPGSGPRHLVLHPNGRFAYVTNEMGLTVTAFARDPATGHLTPLESVPTPENTSLPTKGVTTSEILCHPNGRWLYVSSRGDNTLIAFAIQEDGCLTRIQNTPAGVEIPRGMGLDPSGRWLVVAGQKDNRLVSFAIDPATGHLAPSGHSAEAPAPVCVTFVP